MIDKPAGWTSHDVVNKVRRFAGTKKVGHLGTLDPLATGVLPLVVGKATRLARFYSKDYKAYTATIRFGHSTNTYDREGEATSPATAVNLNDHDLPALLEKFRGKQMQTPPPVSAKKINGVPAYKLARQSLPVELEAVEIEVSSLCLLSASASEIQLSIECSAGTYIRSIAHELGQLVGCGAYIEELRRTRSGDFDITQAHTLDIVEATSANGQFEACLLKGEQLLPDLATEFVTETTEADIRLGRDFRTSPFRVSAASPLVKAINREGEIVAIGEQKLPNLYHPVVVL